MVRRAGARPAQALGRRGDTFTASPEGTTREARRPHNPRSARRQDAIAGYLLLAPVTIGLLVFQFYPMVRGGYLSFTKSGFFGGSSFNGLENYRRLVSDPEVIGAFRNSFVYTLIILLGVPIAMFIADRLNASGLRFKTIYRVLFFLPVVVIPVAAGLTWATVLNGDYGPVNAVLEAVGIPGQTWLQDKRFALAAVGIVGIWSTLGYNVVLFLAGLQNIPKDIYDAAAIDGAGRFRTFRSLTVPMLTPVTFFVSVTSVITAMQMFDLMFTMIGVANGGLRNPTINDTQTVVYLFYRMGFVENDRGYASAIAIVLMLVVLVLTAIQFRLQRRWVEYA